MDPIKLYSHWKNDIIFNNFLLKIETSCVETVVMPILETRNVNDGYMYVWFIFFLV